MPMHEEQLNQILESINNNQIEELDFRYILAFLDSEQVARTIEALRFNTSITHLWFTNPKLGNEEMTTLSEILKVNTTITYISRLQSNFPTTPTAKRIGIFLRALQ
jgi:hypothetical protein